MWIDYPLCNLKTCRKQFDGNCIDKRAYEKCSYKNPWIPCSVMLPEEGRACLLTITWSGNDDIGITLGYLMYGDWRANTGSGEVIAWVYAPLPYKPEETT